MHRVSTAVFRLVADCGKNCVSTIGTTGNRFGGINYIAKRCRSSDYVVPEVYNPIYKLLILKVLVCYNICIVPHCKYLEKWLNIHGYCLYYVVLNVLVRLFCLLSIFKGNKITQKMSYKHR